jgi:hypothetical protein
MNYIKQLNWFREYLFVTTMATAEIALYHALLMVNNRCGWSEWFTVGNSMLQELSGISRTHMILVRDNLVNRNLIEYKKSAKVNRAGNYRLICYISDTGERTIYQISDTTKDTACQISDTTQDTACQISDTTQDTTSIKSV